MIFTNLSKFIFSMEHPSLDLSFPLKILFHNGKKKKKRDDDGFSSPRSKSILWSTVFSRILSVVKLGKLEYATLLQNYGKVVVRCLMF